MSSSSKVLWTSIQEKKEGKRDPRPWYEKYWPYMKHGQRIKVISAWDEGGILRGRESKVHKMAAKWIARLSSTVNYDLKKKLFVFTEQGIHDVPPSERKTWAKVNGFRDRHGQWLPAESQDARVTKGDYLLVDIELFTSSWPRFSTSIVEENVVHELLHVVRPKVGQYAKDGGLWEDEEFMHETTRKLIRDFRRLAMAKALL